MMPFLSDAEIAFICEPLVAPSAQIRYFQKLGMLVHRKPNGRALVARAEFERALVGHRAEDTSAGRGPDRSALLKLFKGKNNGSLQK
jgi:hypothetical protein